MDTYEKKYKEALLRAKGIHSFSSDIAEIKRMEQIFPELKESEDERIRKVQLDYWRSVGGKEWHGVPVQETIAWLEKQGEQKPADKVESKFKIGDWVVKENIVYHIDKISGVYLILSTLDGTALVYHTNVLDNDKIHLWTIQDAKDGDVLAGSKKDVILMFRGIGNTEWDDVLDYHCYYDCYYKDFIVQDDVEYWGNTENNQLVPATKEQRDLLFQKMKEAGYKWDEEKKELRKMEKNSNDRLDPLIDEEIDLWIKENSNIHHDNNNIVELMRDMAYDVTTLTRNLYK